MLALNNGDIGAGAQLIALLHAKTKYISIQTVKHIYTIDLK